MRNFEFEYKGEKYWYSRSVVCVMFAFARDVDGELCVLANKRGSGVIASGAWNCPCGHLDFDEDCNGCAIRETFEETNVRINREDIHLFTTNSIPNIGAKTQPVSFLYYALLPKFTHEYSLSKENMEMDEVSEIKWIKVSDIDNYDWAFNHLARIKQILSYLNIGY